LCWVTKVGRVLIVLTLNLGPPPKALAVLPNLENLENELTGGTLASCVFDFVM